MGFRTLAIERRSTEVWTLLGAVKTEFTKFGTVLDGIQKNLHRAATKIDEARRGTRTIQRKLSDVQELSSTETAALLEGVVINVVDDGELLPGWEPGSGIGRFGTRVGIRGFHGPQSAASPVNDRSVRTAVL